MMPRTLEESLRSLLLLLPYAEEESLRSFLSWLGEDDLNVLLDRWNSSHYAKRRARAALQRLHDELQHRQRLARQPKDTEV